jgi:LPS sulfotransferase NodH
MPAATTKPKSSYLICATPRSGSTLLCEALKSTGIAGLPEEYFEALRHSGLPRRPQEYFIGAQDRTILRHLGELSSGDGQPARSRLWDRHDYEPFLNWAIGQGTTPNGVFGAKLMWGYFGDFVSLLREIPEYRKLPTDELLPTAFPDLSYIRVVRANKVRQAVSLWKAVQTATWRQEETGLSDGADIADAAEPDASNGHGPRLKFHYHAIEHLLGQILAHEACWDAFFEHCRIRPHVVVYEDFVENYEQTARETLSYAGVEVPEGTRFERRMQRQTDDTNRNWARRFSELKLNTDPDLATAELL